MKINPETLHNKFDIYVLIIFLIIILRYKKHDKNMCAIALERYFSICRIIETRPPLNLQHMIVIVVNAVFIVTIPNLDSLVNDPIYYKIICSSPLVHRATIRME